MHSVPVRILTTQTCPVCKTERRLVAFRRWNGRHRALHVVCNVCDPPASILDMSAQRRANMLAKGVSTMREHRLEARDARVKRQGHMKISVQAVRRLDQARRRNWMSLLLTPLREEHRWARRHAQRLKAVRILTEHSPPTKRERFFELYAQTLARMRRRAHDALTINTNINTRSARPAHSHSASVLPTLAQRTPLTYLDAQEWVDIKQAYADCERTLKGRGYRDPWMIFWGN
jgi:hypothetical protein